MHTFHKQLPQKMVQESYVKELRKAFSGPKMALPDGSLNHKYFKEKVGTFWGQQENETLIQAIRECGIGNWEMIKMLYFKKRVKIEQQLKQTDTELRLRTQRLLKIHNLDKYQDLKLTKEQIQEEANKNMKEGMEKRKFKHGIYYNNP
eukprot:TRINITY_DN1067_c0_g1_i1.p2 TRINITY_DN1067_c0_g1~~TRINITY_DN1067_c0_g1_i1.p2  ORF type:complete len:168 (-),score=18.22 TRINITY_DN1067_c0_g1_i1:179-622(-)